MLCSKALGGEKHAVMKFNTFIYKLGSTDERNSQSVYMLQSLSPLFNLNAVQLLFKQP